MNYINNKYWLKKRMKNKNKINLLMSTIKELSYLRIKELKNLQKEMKK